MPKTIVIIGGGFAGAYCARYLERSLPRDWQLILFSQENYLTFTPLLAEVVGASISPLHVVRPVRQILRRTVCRTASVTRLNLSANQIDYQLPHGATAAQPYDHLVIACGMVVNTNVIPGAAAHSFPLKTLGDALALRNRLISQLESAEVETDPAQRRHRLSFAVLGGGFSGVEVAGEMYDLLISSIRYYPSLRKDDVRVVLIHSHDHILPELPASLGEYARARMAQRGIQFCLKARAQAVTELGVRLADGTTLPAATVVCTIGNTINPLLAASDLPLERGRVRTEPDMRVSGHANVWALGDCALVPNAHDGQPSPALAQFALRQAKQLAVNLTNVVAGRPTRPFSYRLRGMFAAIGHRNAVGKVFFLKFAGLVAWFLWRAVYLSKMPTLARKFQVAFDWAWDLFFPRDIVQLNVRETRRVPRAHYEPGEYVFKRGDAAQKFYVIERGKAACLLEGWDEPVLYFGPGDFFGEAAIVHSGSRLASVRAEEPLDVMAIDQGPFQDLLDHLRQMRTNLERRLERLQAAWKFHAVVRGHSRLNAVPVREVMTTPVPTLPGTTTFGEAVAHFQREEQWAYVILDEAGRPQGICTTTDLHNALLALKPLTTPLAEIMSRPLATISEAQPVAAAMLMFLRQPIRRLVVVADDDPQRLVGMITPFEILERFAATIEGDGTMAAVDRPVPGRFDAAETMASRKG
jgi:NADH dehydrogenase